MKTITAFFLLITTTFLTLTSFEVNAELPPKEEHRVKSLFIFSIAKYIQWPDESDELVIGIITDNKELVEIFNETAAERSTSKKVTIKRFYSIADVEDCNLLFVSKEKELNEEQIASLDDEKTLIVTEKEGLAKKGSAINLINKEGKLRFEINKQVVEKSGLKVSSKLIDLAILI